MKTFPVWETVALGVKLPAYPCQRGAKVTAGISRLALFTLTLDGGHVQFEAVSP